MAVVRKQIYRNTDLSCERHASTTVKEEKQSISFWETEKQKQRGQKHPQRGTAVIREGTWVGKAFGSLVMAVERPRPARRGAPQKAVLQESTVKRRGKWIFALARWRMCSEQRASRNKSSFSSPSSLPRSQSPQSTNDCSELMNMCCNGAVYEASSNFLQLWFILQTLAKEESYHYTSLRKFFQHVAFSDCLFSLWPKLLWVGVQGSTGLTMHRRTASLRCIGLYPYIFGHQKQGSSFSSNSTNARKKQTEYLTKGPPCYFSGKKGPSSAALHHWETGRAVALASCSAQWIILIFRDGYFASIFPMEAEVWVPKSCTAEPQYYCHHHPTGTCVQQAHQLLPHPGRRNMNKP